jgi:aspartate 1-decarboxylase
MYIIRDVISYNGKTTYAKSGEKVTIIADFDNVAIVQNNNGVRFPTLFSNLSKTKK